MEFTRNTFDLNVVPMVKNLSHLPIIVDPSHATGRTDLVIPVTLAGLAAGADGLMVEIHPKPHEALSDGNQSLNYDQYARLLKDINLMKESILKLREQKNEELMQNAHH